MIWIINRPAATGKKKNQISCGTLYNLVTQGFKKETFFDVKSAKKGVSLSEKPFATSYRKIKTYTSSDIKRHIFSPPISFS